MNRFLVAVSTLVALSAGVQAQTPVPPVPPAVPAAPPVTFLTDQNARDTQRQLRELLQQLPPSVGEVLALDPSLLNQPDYLAAYPTLVAFLSQHPDIRRNPSFYFGERAFRERDPREAALDLLGGVMAGIGGLIAFIAVLVVITWVIRQTVDYRRWNRLTRTQIDVHTKLLDRLTNNEDLLAYMQTPAGRRFLESAPIALDSAASPIMAAPVSRILWSVQLGIVLLVLGFGFWLVRFNIAEELSQPFYVIGVVTMALGVGFVISAGASSFLSARFGLLQQPPRTVHE